MTPDIFVKKLRDHAEDCGAARMVERGHWPHPWYLTPAWDKERRDRIGRRHRHGTLTGFLSVVCNDPLCPAKAIVRRDDLEDAIAEALQ